MRAIRVVPFSVTRAVTEAGEFGGLASVFGVVDSYDTVFDAGCFARTLKHHGNEVPITKHHDARVGIGMAHAIETDKGLKLDPGRLNVQRSEAAVEVYGGLPHKGEPATGYYSQMSHGFDPVVAERDPKDGKIHFREVKLYEVALVMRNFAANPKAKITKVRSALLEVRDAIREDRVDELGGLFSRFADSLEAFVIGSGTDTEGQEPEEQRSPLVLPEGQILSTIRETETLFRDLVDPSIDTRQKEDSSDVLDSLTLEDSIVVSLRSELAAIGEDLKVTSKE